MHTLAVNLLGRSYFLNHVANPQLRISSTSLHSQLPSQSFLAILELYSPPSKVAILELFSSPSKVAILELYPPPSKVAILELYSSNYHPKAHSITEL